MTPRQNELNQRIEEMQAKIKEIAEQAQMKSDKESKCTNCEKAEEEFSRLSESAVVRTALTEDGFGYFSDNASSRQITKQCQLTIKAAFDALKDDEIALLMLQVKVAMTFKDLMEK